LKPLSNWYLSLLSKNSDLSEDMVKDGFEDVVSIDYSDVVIDQMKERQPKLSFAVMDVRKLVYKKSAFDIIVDKGTLDAILCGSESARNADAMLSECHRVLKPGGVFCLVTYGTPQSRISYLEKLKYKWEVEQHTVGKTRFMYIMTKREG